MKKPTLVFFPGLGADDRLAPFHVIPGFEARWIAWPELEDTGGWEAFMEKILPAIPDEAIYLGISFGGLVALEAARHKRPLALVLIGSLYGSREIPFFFRLAKPLLGFLPAALFDLRFVPKAVISWFFGIHAREHLELFQAMARDLPPARVKQLCKLLLAAAPLHPEGVPILALHGDRDRLLPLRLKHQPIQVVAGGGHLISMTHAPIINRAIESFLAR
jgi:pimeloyl-ACP methyl ester carboxylesterase